MSDIMEVNYEEMGNVGKRFTTQAEEVKGVRDRMIACLEDLKGGGWIGDAANAFFQEMDSEVLPAVQRLEAALQESSAVTGQVQSTFQQAEEEASGLFRNV